MSNVKIGEVIYNMLAFGDDLILIMDRLSACEKFGMKR